MFSLKKVDDLRAREPRERERERETKGTTNSAPKCFFLFSLWQCSMSCSTHEKRPNENAGTLGLTYILIKMHFINNFN